MPAGGLAAPAPRPPHHPHRDSLDRRAFVFYLLYAELFVIGNICLWCTAVHLLAIALFAILAFGAAVVENPTAR